MGVHEGRGRLQRAMRDLSSRWLTAQEQWRDSQAERLEKELLDPLAADVKAAMTAMEQLDRVLGDVRRACE